MSTTVKPPRADARRNTELLVTAAKAAVIDNDGPITAHDLARRAGVGIGTFYRRVGSLDELLSLALRQLLDEVLALAAEATDDDDPWAGFLRFARSYVRLRAVICGVNAVIADKTGLDISPELSRLRDAIQTLTRRARDAGELRADLDWTDVAFALAAVVSVDHTIGLTADKRQWRHNLRILLDGLRPSGKPRVTDADLG